MDGSIRVSTKTKRIEVNDDGECIEIKLGDAAFTNGLVTLIKEAQIAVDELEGGPQDPGDAGAVVGFTEKHAKACSEICGKIDALFRDDVCRKVFGDQSPDLTSLSDFFCQLAGLIQQFEGERRREAGQRIAKYTAKYHQGGGDGE